MAPRQLLTCAVGASLGLGSLQAASSFVASSFSASAGHLRATAAAGGALETAQLGSPHSSTGSSVAPAVAAALGATAAAALAVSAVAAATTRQGAARTRRAALSEEDRTVTSWRLATIDSFGSEEGRKSSAAFDTFNENYPLSSPKQKRTEVTSAEIPRPEDLLESSKFPMFGGSVGGYMSKQTRERHAITWTSEKEQMFPMPTFGFAIMNKGENLCYFRKKEQCIALSKKLRSYKITNFKIYRIKKDGAVIFLHPSDGVFPEKVNPGRVAVNFRPMTVAQNVCRAGLKWTVYSDRTYEADPLTTLFIKAKIAAFQDIPNLFPLPPVNFDKKKMTDEEFKEYVKMAGFEKSL